jgi:hypothetical protein
MPGFRTLKTEIILMEIDSLAILFFYEIKSSMLSIKIRRTHDFNIYYY